MKNLVKIFLFCACAFLCACSKGDIIVEIDDPGIYYIKDVKSDAAPYAERYFVDKDGKIYHSVDESVCNLSFDKLCESYRNGELANKAEVISSCDGTRLMELYRTFVRETYSTVYKTVGGEDADTGDFWYGIYKLMEGTPTAYAIHISSDGNEYVTDNETVNRMYDQLNSVLNLP